MQALRGTTWLLAMMLSACASAPVVPAAAAAAAPLPPLAGTRWAGKPDPRDDGHATPRLEFAEGGQLHGYTGCNMLNGQWSEEGGEIRFSGLFVTKRYCVGVGSEVEQRLLAALSNESRATRTATTLTVTSPKGARYEFSPAAAA